MRRAWALLAFVVGLSACNVVNMNHWLLSRRFARAGLDERAVALPSGHMRYFTGGHGPPLLLLHGFGFGAIENWAKQGPYFAPRHQVIAPDLYWFRRSVPDAKIETVGYEAESVRELLDALHVDRVDIVGASFGGLVALRLALAHPERVGRLVLVDSVGMDPTPEEKGHIADAFLGEHRMEQLLMPTELARLKHFLEIVVYRHKPPFPDWVLRQAMAELGRNREPKTKLCRDMAYGHVDVAALATLKCPTLVVWGRKDPLLLVSMGERLARAIPGAEFLVFEDAAHSAMIEQPGRFNEAVARFLDGVPLRPGSW